MPNHMADLWDIEEGWLGAAEFCLSSQNLMYEGTAVVVIKSLLTWENVPLKYSKLKAISEGAK